MPNFGLLHCLLNLFNWTTKPKILSNQLIDVFALSPKKLGLSSDFTCATGNDNTDIWRLMKSETSAELDNWLNTFGFIKHYFVPKSYQIKIRTKNKTRQNFHFFSFLNIQIMRQIVSLHDKKEQKTKNSIDVKMNFEKNFSDYFLFKKKYFAPHLVKR